MLFLKNKDSDFINSIEDKYKEICEVEWISGAAMIMKREVFNEINGFDERFFMYFEDLDFAFRAKKAGWQSYYLAETKALHYGGGASYQVKDKRLFYMLNSRVLYIAKHFGRLAALGILFASVVVEFLSRLGWNIRHFSWYNLRDTFSAYGMLLRRTPQLIIGLVKN